MLFTLRVWRIAVLIFAGLTALLFAGGAQATTVYVNADTGNDETGDGSASSPYRSIEFAYAKTPDYATLLLADGTYPVTNRQLTIDRPVIVKSETSPANCIVKGAWSGPNANNTNGRGVLHLTHKDGRVEGVTLTGGNRYNYSPYAVVYLEAGIVTNCWIIDNVGGTNGGGVRLNGTDARVTGCFIARNKAIYNNSNSGFGAGVFLAKGLVDHCVISNNFSGSNGAGVYMENGVLRDSLVVGNHKVDNATAQVAEGGGVYLKNGTIERCVIRGNYAKKGAGAFLTGGLILNSLVDGNVSYDEGAGIWNAGGTVLFCTVVENTSQGAYGGTGFYQKSGTTRNTVIYGNPCGTAGDAMVAGGTFDHNFTMLALDGFTDSQLGNQHGNVFYRDAASGDYTLLKGSKAIDGGVAVENVTSDLAGVARPQDESPDMGCYENILGQGPLSCTFNVPENADFYQDGEATFLAVVDGADQDDLVYEWYFDGVKQPETGAEITWRDIGLGRHDVELVVKNQSGEAARFRQPGVIRVSTDHVYANVNGSDTYPYDTPEKGAKRLQDALDAVLAPPTGVPIVTVKPGQYCPYSKWFVLNRPIRLESSDGPSVTSLYANDPNGPNGEGRPCQRVLYVNHPEAFVTGFTVSNGYWYSGVGDSGPGAMRMDDGVVTNCVFTRNRGGDLGGAIRMKGGTLTHCEVFDNYARYNNDACNTRGGGVYLEGGMVEFCRIYRNWAAVQGDTGAGVWMSNGELRNCDIFGNFSKSANMKGIGLYQKGGLVECCTISNNNKKAEMSFPKGTSTMSDNGGGVYLEGGTLRNCLIADNAAVKQGAGVYQTGGTLEYCTVTANTSANQMNSGLYLDGKDAIARYNILWGNGTGVGAEPSANISLVNAKSFETNVVDPATEGTGNIGRAPGFKNAPNADWTLAPGSPAIDAGPAESSVRNDLLGQERPKDGDGLDGAANDLGCYEAPDAREQPLACSFTIDQNAGLEVLTTRVTATVIGFGSDGECRYDWTVDGGEILDGQGTAEVEVRFSSYGTHAISLRVQAGDAIAEAADPAAVRVGATKMYLNGTGSGAWPYATPETATNDICEVLASAIIPPGSRIEIEVDDGDYPIYEKWIGVTAPVYLHSKNGPENVIFRSTETAAKLLRLDNSESVVEGLTLSGRRSDGSQTSWNSGSGDSGGSVRVLAGTLRDCIIQDVFSGLEGGGADIHGGRVEDCRFIRCQARYDGNPGKDGFGGGFVVLGPAVVSNCIVSNSFADAFGGGAWINAAGAIVTNCLFVDCRNSQNAQWAFTNATKYPERRCAGVVLEAGLLVDSEIRACSSPNKNADGKDVGGLRLVGSEAKAVNVLVCGNAVSHAGGAQGLQVDNGQAVNCTVVDNGTTAVPGAAAVAVLNGTLANTIVWANDACATQVKKASGTITRSCFPEATGTDGNLSVDPRFRNPARGDWRLKGSSPCVDAGDWRALGADRDAVQRTVDLRGVSRLRGRNVDLGAYECHAGGLILLVR